ncbi:MAG: ABC transporter ATP-binding protein/permease [Oscillospiraceae bacterium]|nr:ABC transporter ATP-binding protein/permease [Oscillospiraceae bacterium]
MGVISGFRRLFGLFNRRQRVNSVIMLGLIAVGGVVETIGIGLILPFTTALLDQESIRRYPVLEAILQLPWIGSYSRFIVFMCVGLIIVFVLKSLYMFFLIYVQNRFTLNRQVELSKMLFSSYMNKPYEFFFSANTAQLQRNVNVLVAGVIQGILMSGLQMLTELLVVAFILALLLIVDPISTLAVGAALGGVAALYYFFLKNRLDESAKRQIVYGASMVKTVNEGLGSIKDVKTLGREESFLAKYESSGRGYAKTAAFHNLAYQSPRLLIEAVAVSGLVLIVAINALRTPDLSASLPSIALFGMAAIRIMPSMNRSLALLTNIRFSVTHLNEIFDDLKEAGESSAVQGWQQPQAEKLNFADCIEVRDVAYRYPGTNQDILKNVQLTIKKGQIIGIVGSSGAGKTTLIDILLGLLPPIRGEVLVDGVNINSNISSFRQSVGYVPQDIHMIDDTICANVAFGVPPEKADLDRVWASLEIANLMEYVQALDEKLDTAVGEGGVRLSGGQRQRIGIARAMYGNPEILVFDEATSSLDNESEKIISDAIMAIGQTKTMIIIAHRLNTLDKCDVIYEIKNSELRTGEL